MSKVEHLKKELKKVQENFASTKKEKVEIKKNPSFLKFTNEDRKKILQSFEEQLTFFKSEEERIQERIKNLSK